VVRVRAGEHLAASRQHLWPMPADDCLKGRGVAVANELVKQFLVRSRRGFQRPADAGDQAIEVGCGHEKGPGGVSVHRPGARRGVRGTEKVMTSCNWLKCGT